MDLPGDIGRRVGILGGTFDPVHNGHLALGRAVRHDLNLDAVLFIPAFLPPHKYTHRITPFAHRVAMLRLAIEHEPSFIVSDLEAKRQGPSFSIDTLRTLRAVLAAETELFFMVGMDAFAEIATWKEYDRLLDHCHFVVVERPDQCGVSLADLVTRSFPGYQKTAAGCWQAVGRPGRIHSVCFPPVAVSSTAIREDVAAGLDVASLLPSSVARYIAEHGLYHEISRQS